MTQEEGALAELAAKLTGAREGFAPCPTCKQYSHSIGEDKLTEAFNHFHTMYAHPVRGHPMGYWFEEKTRDMAQVLMSAVRANLTCQPMPAIDDDGWCEWIHPLPGYLMQCCDCGLVHEAEFEITERDESNTGRLNPGERDDAIVIFRMRRTFLTPPQPEGE